MRKDFGKQTWAYPLPVFIIATYNEDGTADAMNAAWGGIYDTNQFFLCLSDDHKTTQNIRREKAFTVSIANVRLAAEADYLGIVSGNDVPDKVKRAGLVAEKSRFVNAPVLTDFPMSIECTLNKFNEDGMVIGDIVNVGADESVLGENGKIDPEKLQAISFDPVSATYLKVGGKAGNAFRDGKKFG